MTEFRNSFCDRDAGGQHRREGGGAHHYFRMIRQILPKFLFIDRPQRGSSPL